ncbi:DUF3558 family protein [Actinosynnema pretiosum subsp. pretiosum]|uniref:DUF3558 family protein n=1 Tax=Actinosynnema pretiosum subsp. pretiosum TaxID=103721 RepID=A0AA45R6U8_9PSEU|nr:DUF3558 family protein [Actinosynnema pretiosum subsp. pretiosum]
MRRSRSWLALVAVVLSVTGCSYSVNGAPVAAPDAPAATCLSGAPSPSAPPTRPSSSSSKAAAKIAHTCSLADLDSCELLSAKDLKVVGTIDGEPTPRDSDLAGSCQFMFDDGSATRSSVVVAPYRPYSESRTKQPGGHEEVVEGNSAWVSCEMDDRVMVCTATLAVSSDKSLLLGYTKSAGNAEEMTATMLVLLKTGLGKLPPA